MFKEEEKFTLSLTKYTREQFSGGIAHLASAADKTKYELLDTTKPDSFLVKGIQKNELIKATVLK